MTNDSTQYAKQAFVADSGDARFFLRLKLAASTLLHWQQRVIERNQLRELERHYLDDMGMTLAERDAEASKPFWKA